MVLFTARTRFEIKIIVYYIIIFTFVFEINIIIYFRIGFGLKIEEKLILQPNVKTKVNPLESTLLEIGFLKRH